METTTRNKTGGSEVLKLPYDKTRGCVVQGLPNMWLKDSYVKDSVGEPFSIGGCVVPKLSSLI